MERVDLPSVFMVVAFKANIVIDLYVSILISILKEVGVFVLAFGCFFFSYLLLYLRSGFARANNFPKILIYVYYYPIPMLSN